MQNVQLEHDSSKPIIIPSQENQNATNVFGTESYHSFRQSPSGYQSSSSVNSNHSHILNNSYGHPQFTTNYSSLRTPYNASPTSNFSPRADPSTFSHQNHRSSISENASALFQTSAPRQPISYSRPSLLTSKLASSSSITTSNPLSSLRSMQNTEDSSSQTYNKPPPYSDSVSNDQQEFTGKSISIKPPSTSQHFKTSDLVNVYTPNHNTPSVISSSYSSAPGSVPSHFVNPSSFQQSVPYFPRTQPTTNVFTETAKSVEFSKPINQSAYSSSATLAKSSEADSKLQKYSSEQVQQQNLQNPNSEQRYSNSSSTFQSQQQPENHTPKEQTDNTDEFHLDIVNHPVDNLLLMLSALLQKIIEANDRLHPHHYHHASKIHDKHELATNVLAFHGVNVPAISIHEYLRRILKYCPVTNEVFLTLLVYFDRIAKRANIGDNGEGSTGASSSQTGDEQLFVMDSYNIHRLIIAGITVASKFFSDIFYKNERYAKVGGLPLEELNHLELQFLLLNDFRLLIQVDELQRYADLLLKFWKRELAKKKENLYQSQSQLQPESQTQSH